MNNRSFSFCLPSMVLEPYFKWALFVIILESKLILLKKGRETCQSFAKLENILQSNKTKSLSYSALICQS